MEVVRSHDNAKTAFKTGMIRGGIGLPSRVRRTSDTRQKVKKNWWEEGTDGVTESGRPKGGGRGYNFETGVFERCMPGRKEGPWGSAPMWRLFRNSEGRVAEWLSVPKCTEGLRQMRGKVRGRRA